MEPECQFVCSRGLLKSCTFHSPNPRSSCNEDVTYLYEMLSSEMFHGMSIYVCSDLLKFFVLDILPHIKNIFVLVTGDSDLCVPNDALNDSETTTLLENVYLLKWFAQNTRMQGHKTIVQLPIGLDYHTISGNPTHGWKTEGEGYLPKEQEDLLIQLRSQMNPFYERSPTIYVNFSLVNDKFNQRNDALREIPNELLLMNQEFTKRSENWTNTMNCAFVLSPFGMGMDCHRTWEALCLGAIPILKAPDFREMFEDLPVLIVNEWTEVTRELLDNTLNEFKHKEFNYDKLMLQYWLNDIN
jgi:hypothetical protein